MNDDRWGEMGDGVEYDSAGSSKQIGGGLERPPVMTHIRRASVVVHDPGHHEPKSHASLIKVGQVPLIEAFSVMFRV